jgi:NAD(P) transhydrogenase subunit alpha
MRIAVCRESALDERRVALVPESVARLVKAGHEVRVEAGAGIAAGHGDDAYRAVGAEVGPMARVLEGAEVVAVVRAPAPEAVDRLPAGSLLVGLLQPATPGALLERLAARGIQALAMERVPRTTRAQAMDALSSQASLAGYKAVLLGAAALPRVLPMMTTAAGTLAPARVFVVGAGVAGLQAIATARRLGAVTSAFDVRPEVREQVQSLGAGFVEAPSMDAGGPGGYARELGPDEQARVLAALAAHVKDVDLVVTTAALPGRAAPRLVTGAMVASMRPGSVVVDLAAESGGNCELTRAGEVVVAHGVTVLGPVHLAATVPYHASQAYSRNVLTLLQHLSTGEGALRLDPADEIAGAMLVVHGGRVR